MALLSYAIVPGQQLSGENLWLVFYSYRASSIIVDENVNTIANMIMVGLLGKSWNNLGLLLIISLQ